MSAKSCVASASSAAKAKIARTGRNATSRYAAKRTVTKWSVREFMSGIVVARLLLCRNA